MVGVTAGQERVIPTTLEEQVVRPVEVALVGDITTEEAVVPQGQQVALEKSGCLAGKSCHY